MLYLNIAIPNTIILCLFVVACICELVFAYLEKEKYRRIVKPFCMLLLGVYAVVAAPQFPLIYIGAFLGMIGDILLIAKGKYSFYIGSFAFFFGHICYVIDILVNVLNNTMPIRNFIILGVCFIVFFMLFFMASRKLSLHIMESLGMSTYYAFLLTLLPLTIMTFVINKNAFLIMLIVGTILFIVSDMMIWYTRYFKKFPKCGFLIMSTYLIAQTLIVLSLVLTLGGNL